jgi:hypothetical protein
MTAVERTLSMSLKAATHRKARRSDRVTLRTGDPDRFHFDTRFLNGHDVS